jgi:PilZ domain
VQIIERFIPPRAPRVRRKILAKLLRDNEGEVYEEPVIIRDISASGTLLAIPLHTGLTARDLKEVRLKLRVPGIDDMLVKARLVRVSGADTDFVYAGFRFDEAPRGLGALLGDLMHATRTSPSDELAPRPPRATR